MRASFSAVPLLASLSYALPQATQSCDTTTVQVIIPTSTATYYSTYVTTVEATTAKDLGTFTDVVRESSTKTIVTVTAAASNCPTDASTVYSTAGSSSPASYGKRALGLHPRQNAACTVTATSTTTYGQTYTFAPAGETSTFTDYTAFTQATVTSTSYGGTAYAVATASATGAADCPATVTQDARCAPSALVSAAGGSDGSADYGLEYANDTPGGGATYSTNATDGSACCQQCVEAYKCAASSWDSRTGECKLEFPVEYDTGELSCGQGLLAFYDAGPNSPMEPGTGLFVASVCGDVDFANAKPDDGS